MFGLEIDKSLHTSMTQQLINQIRYKILHGDLKGGEKLPPSRVLAKELDMARNCIIQVYEQLLAEGYLTSRTGSGTFVSDLQNLMPNRPFQSGNVINNKKPVLYAQNDLISFHAGNPESRSFPRSQWARILKEACLDAPDTAFEYSSGTGILPLRAALSRYLFRTKGIQCDPEQILMIPGTASGIDLLIKVFQEHAKTVIVEDPCIDFIQFIFRQNGFSVHPVPVDHQGMKTEQLPPECTPGLIYIEPSHQFPIGGIMPIGRRLQLLEYARKKNAYIIEDDYDSEFRYQGEPIQSLRHLDPERVIYMGTFSKIFYPGIRMGYFLLPSHLQTRIGSFVEQMNIRASSLEQYAMARFIDDKLLDRHVYKMKKIYNNKRAHCINSLHNAFGDRIEISGENAGLHLLVTFCDHDFCSSDFIKFLETGVEVDWVEDYAINKSSHKNQLVMGYGNLSPEEITEGICRIKRVIG